jgi:hypothetical protein
MNKSFLLSMALCFHFFLTKSQSFTDSSSSIFIASLPTEPLISVASLPQDDIFVYFNLNEKELKMKAILDAQSNYKGKNSGGIWIGVATLIFSPVIGFIPAAVTSGAEPNRKNLNYPDEDLMKDYDYYTSYVQESKKIKKRRNWKYFGIGSAAWLGAALLINNR